VSRGAGGRRRPGCTCDSFSTLILRTGPYLASTSPLMSSARSVSQSFSVSLCGRRGDGRRRGSGVNGVPSHRTRQQADVLGRVKDVADKHKDGRLDGNAGTGAEGSGGQTMAFSASEGRRTHGGAAGVEKPIIGCVGGGTSCLASFIISC
jgi:hypothetical protein